jgi:NitT/TauT family transport system substrate-binding protein
MTEGYALIAKPEAAEKLKDIASFKGKTIATVRLATGDITLRSTLHNAGLDWKKDVPSMKWSLPPRCSRR